MPPGIDSATATGLRANGKAHPGPLNESRGSLQNLANFACFSTEAWLDVRPLGFAVGRQCSRRVAIDVERRELKKNSSKTEAQDKRTSKTEDNSSKTEEQDKRQR